jgi:hypothetical protein
MSALRVAAAVREEMDLCKLYGVTYSEYVLKYMFSGTEVE